MRLSIACLGSPLSACAVDAGPSFTAEGAWAAALPPVVAATCSAGASDCSPAVAGVVTQLQSLREAGDLLGFHRGDAPALTLQKHWQGVARAAAPSGNYLFVSRSGEGVSFVVVALPSRGTVGDHLRSNRIGPRPTWRLLQARIASCAWSPRIRGSITRAASSWSAITW
jgi:hypothetical protein